MVVVAKLIACSDRSLMTKTKLKIIGLKNHSHVQQVVADFDELEDGIDPFVLHQRVLPREVAAEESGMANDAQSHRIVRGRRNHRGQLAEIVTITLPFL